MADGDEDETAVRGGGVGAVLGERGAADGGGVSVVHLHHLLVRKALALECFPLRTRNTLSCALVGGLDCLMGKQSRPPTSTYSFGLLM